MTREIITFTLLFIALVGLMVFFRLRDRKRIRSRTLEAMSPGLREEIQKEREENREKKRKFEEAMKKAGGG